MNGSGIYDIGPHIWYAYIVALGLKVSKVEGLYRPSALLYRT